MFINRMLLEYILARYLRLAVGSKIGRHQRIKKVLSFVGHMLHVVFDVVVGFVFASRKSPVASSSSFFELSGEKPLSVKHTIRLSVGLYTDYLRNLNRLVFGNRSDI